MSEYSPVIEVYEWKEGAPRPGSVRKHRHDCIELLEMPASGPPSIGDVVQIVSKEMRPEYFQVISREFVWSGAAVENAMEPAAYIKMWIHVRRLGAEEYRAEPTED